LKKVFALAPGEDWIVDRFVKEWSEDNADITVSNPYDSNVIWLMADWSWRRVPQTFFLTRKVLTTVHHIVPEKFGPNELRDFQQRDQITTAYHVPNKYTEAFIRPLTQKPIHVIPYWANQKIWRPTGTRESLRMKHGLPKDGYLVGSFQRDTEGHDLKSPKLEKGPDILCDWLDGMQGYADGTHNAYIPLHVVLAGWRRQYVIGRLEARGIAYTYFEKPSQEVINDLYQALDLYPVTARYEGGPQSLIEAGLLGIPCISRPMGIADAVLPQSSINDELHLTIPSIPDVEHLKLPAGYEPFRKLIESL
jgi:hypothetical protein